MKKLEVHPIADMFPLMEGAAFDELFQSITTDGLDEPIVLIDGKILDGRNRYNACVKAKVEPTTVVYSGKPDPASLAAFVWRANGIRRHLDTSQRAMIGAKLATMKQGERTDKTPENTESNGANEPRANLPKVSLEAAAGIVNVGRRTVVDAAKVLASAPAKVVKAVEAGKVSVSAAAKTLRAKEPKPPKPPRAGKQKADPRKFERMKTECGKLIRAVDDLNKEYPGDKFRREAHNHLNNFLTCVQAWRRASN